MTDVHFVHGTGRLLHTGEWVVYATEADGELLVLFSEDRVDIKGVGKHIFARNFELSPFVAIHVPTSSMLLFGDLSVSIGPNEVHGLSASPWVERVVPTTSTIAVGAADDRPDTLRLGEVSAAGFQLLLASASPEAAAEAVVDQPIPEPAPPASAGENADGSRDAPVKELQDVGGAEAPEADDFSAISSPADEPEGNHDEWDPLADPHVDLERIGVVEAPSELVAEAEVSKPPAVSPVEVKGPSESETPDSVAPEDFVPDDTIDGTGPRSRMEPPAPSPVRIPPPPAVAPVIPPPPTGLPSMNGPGAQIPPPPGRTNSDDLKSAPTMPAPLPRLAANEAARAGGLSVRFDDGQIATVGVGLYVGRHPTKNGLPAQYQSVTIRGEHVSRLHWEISVENGIAIIRDLGSNGGTKVETNGQKISVPDGGMQLAPGSTVHFADRWARLETE